MENQESSKVIIKNDGKELPRLMKQFHITEVTHKGNYQFTAMQNGKEVIIHAQPANEDGTQIELLGVENFDSKPQGTRKTEWKITEIMQDELWLKGKSEDGKYEFTAKVYDEGSEFGIKKGRTSKLSVSEWNGAKSTYIINYDRGWDVKAKTDEHKEVLKTLVKFLETAPSYDERIQLKSTAKNTKPQAQTDFENELLEIAEGYGIMETDPQGRAEWVQEMVEMAKKAYGGERND